jgi:hypothetical protein
MTIDSGLRFHELPRLPLPHPRPLPRNEWIVAGVSVDDPLSGCNNLIPNTSPATQDGLEGTLGR